jgi:dihydrofolate synthase/folylpolyglutamate synthase
MNTSFDTLSASQHYLELLQWLFSRQRFGMKPGLAVMQALLARLNHPEDTFDTVLIAGTNGKGSTSSTLASILEQTNHERGKTALFTSPHLTYFAERFVVNGAPLAEATIYPHLAALRPVAEELEATFFEITTALACVLFAETGVRQAVFEVGMGGRLDATNALKPMRSVITNVALDHMEYLGDTESAIAFEKAGILRADTLALTAATGDALEVIRARASELGTTLWSRYAHTDIQVNATLRGWQGVELEVTSPAASNTVHSPLLGAHQVDNVALAVATAQSLQVDDAAIKAGVTQTRWPGRLETIRYQERPFLLDGAHNPTSAQALANALADLCDEPVTLIFGVAAGKDVRGIIAALEPHVRQVIITRAALSPRALPLRELRPLWTQPTLLQDTPQAAIATALAHTSKDDIVVVAGSLYLIGEVRPLLLGQPLEHWERWQ